jgi:hypothetical protein
MRLQVRKVGKGAQHSDERLSHLLHRPQHFLVLEGLQRLPH